MVGFLRIVVWGAHRAGWARIGVLVLLLALPRAVLALNRDSHLAITELAFDVFQEVAGASYNSFQRGAIGRCPELERTWTLNGATFTRVVGTPRAQVVTECGRVDYYRDVEFVDVEGNLLGDATDDPHSDEWLAIDDNPHFSSGSGGFEGFLVEYFAGDRVFTAFNHFIDIKKGPGVFDDYDGYSYYRGSASRDQYEEREGRGVDAWVNWWFNDEYAHAPGHSWYRGCSPAFERYSFPSRYPTREAECRARFPMTRAARGEEGRSIPYSVFMPVDNMARYWYERFVSTVDPATLGPVLHAVQDASVPHHAAGYLGNWHTQYEDFLDRPGELRSWVTTRAFRDGVLSLVRTWVGDPENPRLDPAPPISIRLGEEGRVPAVNWRIDQLVTWVALKAYRVYAAAYDSRRGRPTEVEWRAHGRELAQIATAMSVLILVRATHERGLAVLPAPVVEDEGEWSRRRDGVWVRWRIPETPFGTPGVIRYEYRVEEAVRPGGPYSFLSGWTSAELRTEMVIRLPTPHPVHNRLYRVRVRAVNRNGTSSEGISDGIRVDHEAPRVTLDRFFQVGWGANLQFNFTASDDLALSELSYSVYWVVRGASSPPSPLPPPLPPLVFTLVSGTVPLTGATATSAIPLRDLPLQDGVTYHIKVHVADRAGNASETATRSATVRFRDTTTPPAPVPRIEVQRDEEAYGRPWVALVTWDPVRDPESSIVEYQVKVWTEWESEPERWVSVRLRTDYRQRIFVPRIVRVYVKVKAINGVNLESVGQASTVVLVLPGG